MLSRLHSHALDSDGCGAGGGVQEFFQRIELGVDAELGADLPSPLSLRVQRCFDLLRVDASFFPRIASAMLGHVWNREQGIGSTCVLGATTQVGRKEGRKDG